MLSLKLNSLCVVNRLISIRSPFFIIFLGISSTDKVCTSLVVLSFAIEISSLEITMLLPPDKNILFNATYSIKKIPCTRRIVPLYSISFYINNILLTKNNRKYSKLSPRMTLRHKNYFTWVIWTRVSHKNSPHKLAITLVYMRSSRQLLDSDIMKSPLSVIKDWIYKLNFTSFAGACTKCDRDSSTSILPMAAATSLRFMRSTACMKLVLARICDVSSAVSQFCLPV